MPPELKDVLDEIEAGEEHLGDLAAAVDRETLEGLSELASAAAGTEWHVRLISALMKGFNDGD